jgi:hypothetical protein
MNNYPQQLQVAPGTVKARAAGNPLAAGLIAVGVGGLVGSLLPASSAERDAAGQVKEQGAPMLSSAAKEVAQNLQAPAQDAVESVKSTAADSLDTVKQEGQSSAQDVKNQAQDAQRNVQQSRG